MSDLVLWLDALRMSDLGKVGGKNASLGEMIGNLAKRGVLAADLAQIGHAQRIEPKHQIAQVNSPE